MIYIIHVCSPLLETSNEDRLSPNLFRFTIDLINPEHQNIGILCLSLHRA